MHFPVLCISCFVHFPVLCISRFVHFPVLFFSNKGVWIWSPSPIQTILYQRRPRELSLLRQEYIQGKHPHHLYAKVKHGSFLTFVYAKVKHGSFLTFVYANVKHGSFLTFVYVKVKHGLFLAFLYVKVKHALFLAFLCPVKHWFFNFLHKIKTV